MFKFNTIKKALIFSFISFVFSASQSNAIELDEATRTIALDGSGKTFVLSSEQVKRGKRLFNATCGACHTGGITKTNPNVLTKFFKPNISLF